MGGGGELAPCDPMLMFEPELDETQGDRLSSRFIVQTQMCAAVFFITANLIKVILKFAA